MGKAKAGLGLWLLAALALARAPGVDAQDGVSVSGDYMAYAVPDYGSVALTQSILESTIDGAADQGSDRPAAARAQKPDWTVVYDPRVSRRVHDEYVSNLRRLVGPERAGAIDAHLREQPAATQFDAFAAPYGLERASLADVAAGYLALMWATANRTPAPTRAQVQGLRGQILASDGRGIGVPAGAAQRQQLAESLIYRVSQVAVQREIARRRGDTALADAIADNARQMVRKDQGVDLRQMQLTQRGLERRR